MPLDFPTVAGALEAQEYIFASTMPWCPHWYCLRRRWVGDIDFEDVVQYMRDHSYREQFGGKWFSRFNVSAYKYWTMGAPLAATILINRALINSAPAGLPD